MRRSGPGGRYISREGLTSDFPFETSDACKSCGTASKSPRLVICPCHPRVPNRRPFTARPTRRIEMTKPRSTFFGQSERFRRLSDGSGSPPGVTRAPPIRAAFFPFPLFLFNFSLSFKKFWASEDFFGRRMGGDEPSGDRKGRRGPCPTSRGVGRRMR